MIYKYNIYTFFTVFLYNLVINSIHPPKCSNCKWFRYLNGNELCKMFKKNIYDDKNKNIIEINYEDSQVCRNNENLCGKKAYLYENINQTITNKFITDSNKILYDYYQNYYNHYIKINNSKI